MTYESPAIEERVQVGGPLIGQQIGSVPLSPAWRRSKDEPQERP